MGYIVATSDCFGCGHVITYNPIKVPSIINPKTGQREPICLSCIERCNPLRIQNGLDPITILPGAFEATDESQI